MPKSRNSKNQKKRSANYSNQLKAAKNRTKKLMIEEFRKMQLEKLNSKELHQTGEVLENTDISITDIEIDDINLDDVEIK